MRLHRFFTEEKIGDKKEIIIRDDRLIHQWQSVFRMKGGESVILFDGSGDDYVCEIVSLDKKETQMKIMEKKKGIVPAREVWLFFSLIKKDNAELILQKCTELGVSHFVPVISERSEKKSLNIERAKKIIIEASEQCGRSDIPELHPVIQLKKAIETYGEKISLIAFDSSGVKTYHLPPTTYPPGLLIGPEGGFTESELDLFRQKNISICSLGKLTLRAETAAISASTLAFLS